MAPPNLASNSWQLALNRHRWEAFAVQEGVELESGELSNSMSDKRCTADMDRSNDNCASRMIMADHKSVSHREGVSCAPTGSQLMLVATSGTASETDQWTGVTPAVQRTGRNRFARRQTQRGRGKFSLGRQSAAERSQAFLALLPPSRRCASRSSFLGAPVVRRLCGVTRLAFCLCVSLLVKPALLQSPDGSAAEPPDLCHDRPYKRWYREVQHLLDIQENLLFPYVGRFLEMTDEEREGENSFEVLQEWNPCALQTKDFFIAREYPITCEEVLASMPSCERNDLSCSEEVLDYLIVAGDCHAFRAAQLVDGNFIQYFKDAWHLIPYVQRTYKQKMKVMKRFEDKLPEGKKWAFFDGTRRYLKMLGMRINLQYPYSFSGAICEATPPLGRGNPTNYEMLGHNIGNKVRGFFAQSRDAQVECATDDLMWEADDCAVEIKKTYRRHPDPGDCTAHFAAASGKCSRDTAGVFDFETCGAALSSIQTGLECYITRLARDSATDFTTYAADEMGGLKTFAEENASCTSGGWMTEIEDDEAAPEEMLDLFIFLRKLYKRLDQLAAFGCKAGP